MSSFLQRNWRHVLSAITFVALIAVAYALRDQIAETFRSLDNVNFWFLLLLLPLQAGYYHFTTVQYQILLDVLGHKLSYKYLMRASLELNFVNSVFPSGGLSGFSYWGLVLRTKGVSGAKSTLVQTMRFVLLFLSFQALLLLALLLLGLDGRANNFMLMISGSIATLMVVGTLATLFIVDSKRRINAFFTFITKRINRLIQVVRRKHPETINIERVRRLFEAYHENFQVLKQNHRRLRTPLLASLAINATEILSIYAVFIAFGQWVNLGAVIIAYAIANFAGLISVAPGGVGVYEGLMVAVLAAGGVPAALSLPVIVMYRILTIAIQVPPGAWYYYQTLHKRGG